jgi:hypothetical protein
MTGDFTRNTFDPAKHYRDVLMQQGRAQVDADWNEQADLTARRDETTTADIVGDCGGPAGGAAFGVITATAALSPAELQHLKDLKIPPLAPGDFYLSAGRYYVDGIQCENEWPLPFTAQPDRCDVAALPKGSYLLYLDVWQRHITALEDGSIRESALGGPDTATRVKTICQVRTLDLGAAIDPNNPCNSGAADFKNLFDPGTAMLTADTATIATPRDPCLVPPSAGFTGLENQLYRVEIHDGGTALDAASNVSGTGLVTLPSGNTPKNQITVDAGSWAAGNTVEIYASKTGSPVMKGQLARIITVSNPNNRVLTLNIPVSGFVDTDLPRLRKISGATWKWSRENGSVVTRVEKIDGNKITVSTLGPDKNLGFTKDAWVEILDDALELESKPGQLVQIDDVDEATRIITLKSAASSLVPAGFPPANYPNGIVPARHPKLRRWEGVAAVKFVGDPNTNWLPLESGVQVRFANGSYRNGHFWQIPARTATAQSPSGEIEWPNDGAANPQPLSLAPRGIAHHFCKLGVINVSAAPARAVTLTSDCRCLWPALTLVPRLFYVSGDGQEVMPDLVPDPTKPQPFFPLPQPLIVGLGNGQCAPEGTKVRFTVILGDGRVAAGVGSPLALTIDVPIGADGMAQCNFHLDGNYPAHYSQRAQARLLDAAGAPCSLPVIFNATLSVAREVAYDPSGCKALEDRKNVQDALSRLAAMVSLYKVSGDGQEGANGEELPKPLVVMAANRCGVATGLEVKFKVITGNGSVAPVSVPTSAVAPIGQASCKWTLGPGPETQELEAVLVSNDPLRPVTQPSTVRFTANLRAQEGGGCCVTVGETGQFKQLDLAIKELLKEKRTDICICLMPGDHKLSGDLKIESPAERGVCLRIAGCGIASRLLMENNKLSALKLASFTLSDLLIYAIEDHAVTPITIEGCYLVSITGCYLAQAQKGDPNDLLTIAGATRVTLAENTIASYWWLEPRMKALGLEIPARFEVGAFDTLILKAAGTLASGGEKAQQEFVKAFRSTIPKKRASGLRTKTVDTEEILTRIDSIKIRGTDRSEAIATFGALISQLLMAPAVAIADANADVSIVDNIIIGEVLIYGTTGGALPADFDNLAVRIKNGRARVQNTSTCSLRIEGNSLGNVVVDSHRIPPPHSANGPDTLIGLFARMSLLDNTFHATDHQWLAGHVISNGNHFLVRDNGITLGTATGDSFICTGTSADLLPVRLLYGVPTVPPTVPPTIPPPDPPPFRESANLITVVSV